MDKKTRRLYAGPESPGPTREAPEVDDLWWMIDGCTPGRRTAFVHGVGDRYGSDPVGTTVFVLDRWSECPVGFRWTLDPGEPAQATPSRRAQDVLDRCFVRTRTGLSKMAAAEYGGDVESAIRTAVDQFMTILGLDQLVGSHA